MIEKNDIIADLHTHTTFSKHAYSTVCENMAEARKNGIKYLATTDHFYNNGDAIDKKNEVIRMMYISQTIGSSDPYLITGGEFNLNQNIDPEINIDKVNSKINWRLFGLHTWYLNPKEIDVMDVPNYFYKAAIGSVSGITPVAFSHIERELYKCRNYSLEKAKLVLTQIVEIAIENNIILEINESSIKNNEVDGVERMKLWIPVARDSGAMFSLGTDAHYCTCVGDFTNTIEMINKFDIPADQILNHKINDELIKKYL